VDDCVHLDGFNKINGVHLVDYDFATDGLARLNEAHRWVTTTQVSSKASKGQLEHLNRTFRWNFHVVQRQLKIHWQYSLGHFQSDHVWCIWKEKE